MFTIAAYRSKKNRRRSPCRHAYCSSGAIVALDHMHAKIGSNFRRRLRLLFVGKDAK